MSDMEDSVGLIEVKKRIRESVWKYLEDHDIARFPRPVFGRIPNFAGADKAALLIRELDEFRGAEVVKVNPDSPQRFIRELVMGEGKILLMPTPRLRGGFIKLDGRRFSKEDCRRASTISGAFKYGEKSPLSAIPTINLIVAGSVAVSLEGGRIGKGEGYSELEYGVLRELGLVDDSTKVVTSVHDCQIVEAFQLEEHDLPIDFVLTPRRLYETHTSIPRPRGIYWDRLSEGMLAAMPVLGELRERKSQLK